MEIVCVFHSVTEKKITVSKIVHAMTIVSTVVTDVAMLSVLNANNQRYADRSAVLCNFYGFFRKMKIIKNVSRIQMSQIKVIARAWKIVQKGVHVTHMPVVTSHTSQQLQRQRLLYQLLLQSLPRPHRLRLHRQPLQQIIQQSHQVLQLALPMKQVSLQPLMSRKNQQLRGKPRVFGLQQQPSRDSAMTFIKMKTISDANYFFPMKFKSVPKHVTEMRLASMSVKMHFKLDGKNAPVWKDVLMDAHVIIGIVLSQLPLQQLPPRTQLQDR